MNDNNKSLEKKIRELEFKINDSKNISKEEIGDLEKEFEKENNKNNNNLIHLIIYYYVETNNIDKVIYYTEFLYKNGDESNATRGIYKLVREHNVSLESLEKYDYPFVHLFLGEEYGKNNIDKAIEHYKKGAEQKSVLCADRLVKYYTTGEFYGLIGTFLERIDYENAIYYADLMLKNCEKTNYDIDAYSTYRNYEEIYYYVLNQMEQANYLTPQERDKYNAMIMNSNRLLMAKSQKYIKEKNIDMYKYYYELAAEKGNWYANKVLSEFYKGKNFHISNDFIIQAPQNLKKSLYYAQRANVLKNNFETREQLADIVEKIIKENRIDLLNDIKLNPNSIYRMIKEGNYHDKKSIFKLLFKNNDEVRTNPYLKKIKDSIYSDAEIITVKNIKDLDIKKLYKLPDNTIVNIQSTNQGYIYELYTLKDIKKILGIYSEIFKTINTNKKEEDVFMQIYIKLGNLISYDYEATSAYGSESTQNKRMSISRNLMTLINKKGVCAGYVNVLKNALDIAGIESEYVPSKSNHAYNKVKINNKWYCCDLTWDAKRIKKGELVEYCLKSEDEFSDSVYHINEDKIYWEIKQNEQTKKEKRKMNDLYYRNCLALLVRDEISKKIVTSPIVEDGGKKR